MSDEQPTEPTPTTDEAVSVDERAPRDRWRISIALIVVASVVGILTTVNTWVERQLLDTDEWVELSDAMLANDEVRRALSAYIVDQLYDAVDVNTDLGDRLPEDLEPLAGLVAGALRGPLTDGVDRLLETDAVGDIWHRVNREAHTSAVALLREEEVAGLSTTGGEIAIELDDLVRRIGSQIGISDERLDEIPDDAARIVIVESSELAAAQNAVAVIELLSALLFVIVVGLYALAIYLAGSRWRDAVFWVGVSLAASGLLVLVGRRLGVQTAADAIAGLPSRRSVASIIMELGTDLLYQVAVGSLVFGLLIAGWAALLGSKPFAVRTRSLLTPVLARGPAVAVLSGAVILLAVLAILPGSAFDSLWRGLLFVVLYAAGIVMLRRQLQVEAAPAADAA